MDLKLKGEKGENKMSENDNKLTEKQIENWERFFV